VFLMAVYCSDLCKLVVGDTLKTLQDGVFLDDSETKITLL